MVSLLISVKIRGAIKIVKHPLRSLRQPHVYSFFRLNRLFGFYSVFLFLFNIGLIGGFLFSKDFIQQSPCGFGITPDLLNVDQGFEHVFGFLFAFFAAVIFVQNRVRLKMFRRTRDTPDDPDSTACFLSLRPLPENPREIADFFRLMKRAAADLKSQPS